MASHGLSLSKLPQTRSLGVDGILNRPHSFLIAQKEIFGLKLQDLASVCMVLCFGILKYLFLASSS